MLRTRLIALLVSVLGAGQESVDLDAARRELRPCLVEATTRACVYLERRDWKRVELSAVVLGPLARALDAEYDLQLAKGLERALSRRDSAATLTALMQIIYWDARDLLDPVVDGELQAKEMRSRLLKARQALRFLSPAIKRKKVVRKGERELGSGALVYVALDTALSQALNDLPSDRRYGNSSRWREEVPAHVRGFRSLLSAALSEFHDGPPDRERRRDP